jgi:hypothetical protein
MLTENQRRAFRRNGFLALPHFARAKEVAEIRAILETLFARQAGLEQGHLIDFAAPSFDPAQPRMPQLLYPLDHAPALRATALHDRVHALAREMLGADAIFAFDHAIIKPAHDGSETPWHQDIAFHDPWDRHLNLTFWMPLQDVGLENSCLHFLPGSHRGRLEPHRPINGDPRIHGLEAPAVSGKGAVAVPLPAGGLSIHESRTLHYAGPNRSTVPRWSYALAFKRRRRDWLHRWRFGPWLRDPLAGLLPAG